MFFINSIDQITKNKSVLINGWVSNFLWLKWGIKQLELEFFYRDTKITEAITEQNGEFSINYVFDSPGMHTVEIKAKHYPLDTDTVQILILQEPLPRKILVCDVDNTVAEVSLFSLLSRIMAKEIRGAKEMLEELNRKYDIVYLTHRDERLSHITKKWLFGNNFPVGPVFFWSFTNDPLTSKNYKKKRIAQLQKKIGANFHIGIGDKKGDILAYKESGIENIFKIDKFSDWEKLREVL